MFCRAKSLRGRPRGRSVSKLSRDQCSKKNSLGNQASSARFVFFFPQKAILCKPRSLRGKADMQRLNATNARACKEKDGNLQRCSLLGTERKLGSPTNRTVLYLNRDGSEKAFLARKRTGPNPDLLRAGGNVKVCVYRGPCYGDSCLNVN